MVPPYPHTIRPMVPSEHSSPGHVDIIYTVHDLPYAIASECDSNSLNSPSSGDPAALLTADERIK